VALFADELPEFSYRLCIPASLTGYAQIYGKYNTSAHDKLLLEPTLHRAAEFSHGYADCVLDSENHVYTREYGRL